MSQNLLTLKTSPMKNNDVNVRKLFPRDIKDKLKKFKQEELEELIIQKITESIKMSGEIGQLRQQALLAEENQNATRARCEKLAEQVEIFSVLLQQNTENRSLSNNKFVPSLKIRKSVGVQVNLRSKNGIQNLRQIQNSSSTSSPIENGIPHPNKSPKVLLTKRSKKISFASPNCTPIANEIPISAPLPNFGPCENNPNRKLPPPVPMLKISKDASGISLLWNMTMTEKHAKIVRYQIFAYEQVNGTRPIPLPWRKFSEVMALPLPMACKLTEFSAGNNYYFTVRAVDSYSRLGQFSFPISISL